MLYLESKAVTITTYAKDRIQERQESPDSPIDTFVTMKEMKYFTLGPEYVMIKVSQFVF